MNEPSRAMATFTPLHSMTFSLQMQNTRSDSLLRKPPRVLLATMAAAAASLTACGGGNDGDSRGQDAQLPSSQEVSANKARGVNESGVQAQLAETADSVTTLTVVASGSAAAGVLPVMEVSVDGQPVGQATVTGPQTSTYSFEVRPALKSGARIDVTYLNDAVINGEDRNLVVRSVSAAGKTLLSTDPGVWYDRGMVDGIDVIPGRAEMDWKGALRFTMPTPLPAWPPKSDLIYHDRALFLDFSANQLEVGSDGKAFLGWHATHKTADGRIDGTDINVAQYDLKDQAWHATAIANVPFPSAGGGYVYNMKVMALPEGDMAVFWDVVDIPPNDRFAFNKPPKVYFSRYAAAQKAWSAPQAVPGDYAIYSFDNGWEVVPAGDGRLLMMWQTRSGVHARFYSARSGTWSTSQDIGAVSNLASTSEPWQVFTSFNRSGSGVVQFGSDSATAPRTLYFDAVRQAWSAVSVAPLGGSYLYGPKSFAVDGDGNVFSALFDDNSFQLKLSKWSAATRQIERTQLVEQSSRRLLEINLNLHADGGLLTWAGDPFAAYSIPLRFVRLSKEGVMQGAPETGPTLSEVHPPSVGYQATYANDLQTLRDDSGKAYSVWSRYECHIDVPCRTVDFRLSTFQPGLGWSAPQSIPGPFKPRMDQRTPFKVSPSGGAALAVKELDFDNEDTLMDVRAMVLE